MKTPNLIIAAIASAGLAFGVVAQGHEKEKEETITSSDVPAAVQQAADTQAKGGKIAHLREYFDPVRAAKAMEAPILGLAN